jgi:2-polyprenyl-3-methyl-5-hydroxy-6-metoxy-1,4-benzoquinol methylase
MSQAPRNLDQEYQDTDTRKYAYDFDYRMHDYILRTFAPLLPQGRALEMGCYKGEFTKKLAQHFDDVTVIEGAETLIAEAKAAVQPVAKHPVRFLHGQFEAVRLEEQFDAVFLIHTLEHLSDPLPVLQRIRDWLTPTGKLFLVVPNAHAPSRQIAVKMGLISHNSAVTEGERLHGHRCTYSLDTLERDARAGGLTVHARGGVFFKPFANFQFDGMLRSGLISEEYLEGCFQLGQVYPDLCASIYLVCGK